MAPFLSVAWLELLDAAFADVDVDANVTIEQIVTGVTRYQLTVNAGRAHVSSPKGAADLTLELDYPTAVALASGVEAPQDALQRGAVRVRGDLRRLPDAAAAATALAGALAKVRDQTSFA